MIQTPYKTAIDLFFATFFLGPIMTKWTLKVPNLIFGPTSRLDFEKQKIPSILYRNCNFFLCRSRFGSTWVFRSGPFNKRIKRYGLKEASNSAVSEQPVLLSLRFVILVTWISIALQPPSFLKNRNEDYIDFPPCLAWTKFGLRGYTRLSWWTSLECTFSKLCWIAHSLRTTRFVCKYSKPLSTGYTQLLRNANRM